MRKDFKSGRTGKGVGPESEDEWGNDPLGVPKSPGQGKRTRTKRTIKSGATQQTLGPASADDWGKDPLGVSGAAKSLKAKPTVQKEFRGVGAGKTAQPLYIRDEKNVPIRADADDREMVKKWKTELERYERYSQKWRDQSKGIVKRYRDEREAGGIDGGRAPKMNIFWSMVETFKQLIYSRTPRPECTRRFKDSDPVGRVASEMMERATTFLVSTGEFDETMGRAVVDYLLVGRAVVWERYRPYIVTKGEAEQVDWETVDTEYVAWRDFYHSPVRTWPEVWWVARRVFLTREEMVDRFGAIGNRVELNYADGQNDNDRGYSKTVANEVKQACVWEIWDKRTMQCIWIAEGFEEKPLDVEDDILNLEDFFPCPCPLYATLTTDSLMPIPDFALLKDQFDELDNLTQRISKLTKALKVVGVCDGSVESLQRLLDEGMDGTLIPIDNWRMFAEKGGIEGTVAWLPIENIVKTIIALYESRDKTREIIYEVSGMADVVRGLSSPEETAAAQKIKGKWAGVRISGRQDAVQKFARNTIRIKAEVVAEQFGPDTLMQMTGIKLPTREEQAKREAAIRAGFPVPPQPPSPCTIDDVDELLKNDGLRSFRVDIETDSTIAPDEEQDKADRMELVTAIGAMLNQALPVVQAVPKLAPAVQELIMFAIRGFRVGRAVEQTFEDALNQASASAQQSQQAPPDPRIEAAQIKAAADQAKSQADIQVATIKAQAQLAEQGSTAQIAQQEMLARQQEHAHDRMMDFAGHAQKQQTDATQQQLQAAEIVTRHRQAQDALDSKERQAQIAAAARKRSAN